MGTGGYVGERPSETRKSKLTPKKAANLLSQVEKLVDEGQDDIEIARILGYKTGVILATILTEAAILTGKKMPKLKAVNEAEADLLRAKWKPEILGKYEGKWIAFRDDKVLANNSDLEELAKPYLKEMKEGNGPLFAFVDFKQVLI